MKHKYQKLPIVNPTIKEIEKYHDTIPCFEQVLSIIKEKIANGNIIEDIGNNATLPDNTGLLSVLKEKI